ncbi:MAG TPA: molybdenum cofactor guanylyltransferase MobA [Rhodocyclaceae bacterium]|nr:molybdenum cofactor guanylyltransferase MobA [Rhodocyclaceae bacterium]
MAKPLKPAEVSGLILAGGQGSRMGGVDKGLLPYQGKPLIEHVIARLTPQVGHIIINANRNADTYAKYGFPVVADASNPQHEEFAGPLAGLLAGLKACKTDWLVTVPCDSPSFPLDLVARLLQSIESNPCADIVAARTNVQTHPVFMLVHKEMTHQLESFLASGERKLGFWHKQNGASYIEFADEAAFANLNTPEELSSLEKNS